MRLSVDMSVAMTGPYCIFEPLSAVWGRISPCFRRSSDLVGGCPTNWWIRGRDMLFPGHPGGLEYCSVHKKAGKHDRRLDVGPSARNFSSPYRCDGRVISHAQPTLAWPGLANQVPGSTRAGNYFVAVNTKKNHMPTQGDPRGACMTAIT